MIPESEPKRVSVLERSILAVLFASTVLSFIALPTAAGDGLLHVWFLDVGQGDAIFIQAPNGNQVLIDGGPDNKVLQELGRIMPFSDYSIDMLVLTHPHADHVNGLIEVLKRYDIDYVFENNIPYDSAEYREWNSLKSEAQVIQTQAGQIMDFGDGAKLSILYPYQPGSDKTKITVPHNFMVVMRLEYGGESLMLTGDMEMPLEKRLIGGSAFLKANFLKVGHHGSKTSTSEMFLQAVMPRTAFIEVGADNRFGHPGQVVLDRLESRGIKYYRSDIDGTVELTLDGRNYQIK